MHQIVEYLIGLVLIGAAFQSMEPVVPSVMGGLVMLNSAMAKGPASAFPMFSRTQHRWLDVVVMVAMVGAAFQPVVEVDGTGRLLLCAIAFVMFFIWLNSDFSEKPARKKRKVVDRNRRARPQSEEIGKKAGRVVGDGVNAAKRFSKKLRDES